MNGPSVLRGAAVVLLVVSLGPRLVGWLPATMSSTAEWLRTHWIDSTGWPSALAVVALITAAGLSGGTAVFTAARRAPSALLGAGVAALQLHYFGIDNPAVIADWVIVSAVVFAGLRWASLAMLVAAGGVVVSRLPGLGPSLGLVVFAVGLLVLCVFRDEVNELMPAPV